MAEYHLFPPRRAGEAFVREMRKPLTASESIVGHSVMFGPLVVGMGLPVAIALGLHRQPSLWMVGALVLTPLALYVLVFGLITRSSDPEGPVRALEAIPVGSLGKLPDGTLGALAGRIVPTDRGTIEGPLTKAPFVWIDVTAYAYRDGKLAQRESRTLSVPFYVEAAGGERALVVPDQDALLRSATHSREERSSGPRRTEVLRACDEMGLHVDDGRAEVSERAFRAGDQVFAMGLVRPAEPFRGHDAPRLDHGPDDRLVVTGETRKALAASLRGSGPGGVVWGIVLLLLAIAAMVGQVLS